MNAALSMPMPAPVWDGPWGRLALAAMVSAFVHFLLIAGFPVDPIGGEFGEPTVITARLEAGVSEPEVSAPAPAAKEPAVPAPAPVESAAPAAPPPEASVPARTVAPARAAEPAPEKGPQKTSPLPGAELPVIRDGLYYPVGQLDVYPSPLTPLRPTCTDASEFKEPIKLLVLISEYGFVDDVNVVSGPSSGLCVAQMVAQVKPVRWSPGIKDGRAVKSRGQLVLGPARDEADRAAR